MLKRIGITTCLAAMVLPASTVISLNLSAEVSAESTASAVETSPKAFLNALVQTSSKTWDGSRYYFELPADTASLRIAALSDGGFEFGKDTYSNKGDFWLQGSFSPGPHLLLENGGFASMIDDVTLKLALDKRGSTGYVIGKMASGNYYIKTFRKRKGGDEYGSPVPFVLITKAQDDALTRAGQEARYERNRQFNAAQEELGRSLQNQAIEIATISDRSQADLNRMLIKGGQPMAAMNTPAGPAGAVVLKDTVKDRSGEKRSAEPKTEAGQADTSSGTQRVSPGSAASVNIASRSTSGRPGPSTRGNPQLCTRPPVFSRTDPNCKQDGGVATVENQCLEAVDLKICLMRTDGTWNCGAVTAQPGQSRSYASCKATGRVWYNALYSAGRTQAHPDPR